ncbi:MAG TPA: hypothetical protein VLA19_26585 [Herpetosiphonaceae bacterium]|nr:hypothetical protein [Herpetosiphonaceae bacterium]
MPNLRQQVLDNTQRMGPGAEILGAAATPNSEGMSHSVSRRGEEQPVASLSVQAGANSRISDVDQSLTLDLADRDYFFVLQIRDAQTLSLCASEEPRRGLVVKPLELERRYHVRVTRGLKEYAPPSIDSEQYWHLTQLAVKYQLEIELILSTLEGGAVTISGIPTRISLYTGENWWYEFELSVPRSYASSELTLELLYREGANPFQWATRLKVGVAQPLTTLPADIPAHYYFPIDTEPPPNTAILRIRREDDKRLALRGWLRDRIGVHIDLAPIDRPPLPSGTLTGEQYLDALHKAVHTFSVGDPAHVTSWLQSVLAQYGKDCNLVIVDQADSHVPWEMLKLSDNRYLGAHSRVVRWTETQYRGQSIALQLQATTYSGRLSAFIDPQASDNLDEHHSLLAQLAAIPTTDPDELELDLLSGSEGSPIGLVYLHSGRPLVYGDEAEALDPMCGNFTSRVEIAYGLVEGNLRPRPLFFVNAPYSGHILRHGTRSCGLANATLTNVAAGYIGVLGPLDRPFALRIAKRLLESASTAEIQPAELLRELRAEAASRIKPGIAPEEFRLAKRDLVRMCMYVYYGNPSASIVLTAPALAASPESLNG